MHLGIEIGGTKLQLGVGAGDGSPLVALERMPVEADREAEGIRSQIARVGRELIARYPIESVGVGFGGPVLASSGRVIRSHQVSGWDAFPLADWCRQTLGCPTVIGNDCDVAALAEARFGAGRGARTMFYVTVGTGVGGGFVIDGQSFGGDRPAVAEIGHLRPGLDADTRGQTVEALASGRGIEQIARDRLGLTDNTIQLSRLAAEGNAAVAEILVQAVQALGWAIGQVVTLLAPEIVVVGGGVSLIGEQQFFAPLRREARRYAFPALADSFQIAPAELGEEVVVRGALALAASKASPTSEK